MRILTLTLTMAGLAACGSDTAADPGANPADASITGGVMAAAVASETIPATRAEVKAAWKCRGLVSAASAAKAILPAGDVPARIMTITQPMVIYWDKRVGQMKAPDMTEADIDALVVSSTRALVTREALERELPAISACLDAQQAP